MADAIILAVNEVTAGYGETPILHGLSMAVETGETVCVIGPNGAGKSTLLKVIVGLLRPRSGQIAYRGQDISGTDPERLPALGIAYVPQVRNVFPSLSVAENIEIIFPRRTPREEKQAAVQRVLEFFPILAERWRRPAGVLSGGERQMLAIARSIALEPKLLILDEPTAALSPKVAEEIFGYIRTINAAGTSILLVEQNARKALTISHRGYVLDGGRVAMTGTGRQLLTDPGVGRLYLGGAPAAAPAE